MQKGGFNFDLYQRNVELIEKNNYKVPKTTKTGTTIVGVVFSDGVVLGADTRATSGPIVADPNCEKIHKISDYIWCAGAGTAADTENTTGMISLQLELLSLSTGRSPRVRTALTLLKNFLFRYHGYISAALVLGGVDFTGPHLHMIHPHGSTSTLPYISMGSGSLAAMAVLETGYNSKMGEEDAKSLVHQAILSGILNDLGSGGNVDLCVIKHKSMEFFRNVDTTNSKRKFRKKLPYMFKSGSTKILEKEIEEKMRKIEIVNEKESQIEELEEL
ncbi:proteasome subunit beta type-7 [Anaeramoeba flamelloides]|uniref:Proteasome subunit beta n=1 Tax=Anaeramoeba flamelloides TaxID=1746091 RepID=A0AAV7Z7A4_9EUKA|nr:proteasome subunit beta type-7 [Anaeramoeba flamelloides]KAJ3445883.1 proteasome subunit beta type-7 [Anaeramoeba flamelloides]